MYSLKEDRAYDIKTDGKDVISDFGGDSPMKEMDTTFYTSIGMKGMEGSGRYFSIDFSDASIRKGDYCKYNKTSEMRADEFWEELTKYSKKAIATVIHKAKTQGLSKLKEHMDSLELMFKKPDVVLGNHELTQNSFIGNLTFTVATNFSSITTTATGDIIITDFAKTYKMRHNCMKKVGEMAKLMYINEPISCVSSFNVQQQFVCTGGIGNGLVKIWDHSIGKHLFTYELPSNTASAQQISHQGDLFAVLDSENYISIFDIRKSKAVHTIRSLCSTNSVVTSFQLEYNQLLLGTSDGPIILPVNCPTDEPLTLGDDEPHKSLFLTKEVVVTAQVGSDEILIMNCNTGQRETLNMPGEQIVDFSVNQSKNTIAIVSTSATHNKYYLRLIKKQESGYEWNEYVKIPRLPYRVHFIKNDEVMVADEMNFCIYGTSNQYFVQSLKEKLWRYLSK